MIFARNDVDYINVPVESGGCPDGHRRPVIQGARVKTWQVTCPACEPFLKERLGDLFATTETDIPETPDETAGREAFEKRGAADRDTIMATALAKLAGVDLPPALRGLIGGSGPSVVTGALVCEAGHDCDPGSKYCGECGSPVRLPAPALCPQGHQVTVSAKFCQECGNPVAAEVPATVPEQAPAPPPPSQPQVVAKKRPLKDMRADELRALARDKGLDDRGTRTDLLERLRAA